MSRNLWSLLLVGINDFTQRKTIATEAFTGHCINLLVSSVQSGQIVLTQSLIPRTIGLVAVQGIGHLTALSILFYERLRGGISIESIGIEHTTYGRSTAIETVTGTFDPVVNTFDSTDSPGVLNLTAAEPAVNLSALATTLRVSFKTNHVTCYITVAKGCISTSTHVAGVDTTCIDTSSYNLTFHTDAIDEDGSTAQRSTDYTYIRITCNVGASVNNEVLDNSTISDTAEKTREVLSCVDYQVADYVTLTIELTNEWSFSGTNGSKEWAVFCRSAINKLTTHIKVSRQFSLSFCKAQNVYSISQPCQFFGSTNLIITILHLRNIKSLQEIIGSSLYS